MGLEFRQIRDFSRGTLYRLLADAYSFDERCLELWETDWKEFDDFFYDNLCIADTCGFITMLDGEPIGMASWDPRKLPKYVEIGHNCIITKYKGNGYGKRQLQESVNRIKDYSEIKKIIVGTNSNLIAPRNYESVGFQLRETRTNTTETAFTGDYLAYEMDLVD
ncbi:MAG: GNAT family N-acetyltransferase [Eubacteriales bacterium]